MERMLAVIRRRRLVVAVPTWLARIQGWAFDTAQRLSFGLFTNTLITRDQVKLLGRDNVVAPGARGLADLGIAPTAMEAVLPEYLYSYRPNGQFNTIQESAARLRS
jgi:NADH dehydrogenase